MKNFERLANLALAGLSLAPLVVKVNPNVNVVLTACLAVYVGCYRSVKPTPPTETMSNEHAMRFPLVGSAMLLSLFLLFKFFSKDLVNAVLTCYFFLLGILAFSATLLPAIKRFLPNHWNENVVVWRFPYFRLLNNESDAHCGPTALEVEFTRSQAVAAIPGFFFCVWYAAKKHWLANNILGLAFCIQGIEMLSLGSFKTGAILLGGLFLYDIFWVFFTPVMVSVAKSLTHLLSFYFPQQMQQGHFPCWTRRYCHSWKNLLKNLLALLLTVPHCGLTSLGIFVALALRFDVSRGKESQYFKSAFFGYTAGLVLTIVVMNWFQAAQPALLYIVPAAIGCLAVHVMWNGDIKPVCDFLFSIVAIHSILRFPFLILRFGISYQQGVINSSLQDLEQMLHMDMYPSVELAMYSYGNGISCCSAASVTLEPLLMEFDESKLAAALLAKEESESESSDKKTE
ncbi:Signal peptide peptidase [Bienertia sinuspersici]